MRPARHREGEDRRGEERAWLRERLSAREFEVLRLLTDGGSNREIAARLGVGYTTVRAHVRSIIDKLDTRSRLEAVARANACDLFGDDRSTASSRSTGWLDPGLSLKSPECDNANRAD